MNTHNMNPPVAFGWHPTDDVPLLARSRTTIILSVTGSGYKKKHSMLAIPGISESYPWHSLFKVSATKQKKFKLVNSRLKLRTGNIYTFVKVSENHSRSIND